MIDPHNITKFDRTEGELQEFALFCVMVAGKNSKVQAKKLEKFLIGSKEPFEFIGNLANNKMLRHWMKIYKLGQYCRLESAFTGLIRFKGYMDYVSIEELESVKGIGPKTARMFVLHSRKGVECAVLDTHILKWLKKKGHAVPATTPQQLNTYRRIENLFLDEAEKMGVSPATLDLQIWSETAKMGK